ncbi:helix-turn-helix transcriptional regulator [Streptomyces sp. bgisy100]|uniref:helix-turn-helix transcriptional regulator n=1 Tax=Streptomyces sp. bgisy100 TaxID=3413783 RepID=UPI003D734E69
MGLPRGRRRRTPGLRREEVAQLSAVGVTWYTWLEQARPIHVSAQVLDAVARALLLDPSERSHLFALAAVSDPAPGRTCPSVSPSLRLMLEQLEPYPACVQNSRYDVLAYNRGFARMIVNLDALPYEDRNCMWLGFTNADWQAALVDLEESQRAMVAKFRAAMAGHLAEPAWTTLLHRLQRVSPAFRTFWEEHEVLNATDQLKRIRNPRVGMLRLHHTSLWLGPRQGPRIVTYVPADDESRERLERLHALELADA